MCGSQGEIIASNFAQINGNTCQCFILCLGQHDCLARYSNRGAGSAIKIELVGSHDDVIDVAIDQVFDRRPGSGLIDNRLTKRIGLIHKREAHSGTGQRAIRSEISFPVTSEDVNVLLFVSG